MDNLIGKNRDNLVGMGVRDNLVGPSAVVTPGKDELIGAEGASLIGKDADNLIGAEHGRSAASIN